MVGFLFHDTRVLGIKWPWHVNFEEVNLRFYVKHFDGTTWKRGTVFVSELVPKMIIPLIANNLYNEHYSKLPMRHNVIPIEDTDTQYLYEWKYKGRWNRLGATVSNTFIPMQPGSAEEFILEHYWGYNRLTADETLEYGVEHVPWRVGEVKAYTFDADIRGLYGADFEPFLSVKPYSAFFAEGSAVSVRVAGKVGKRQAPQG